MLALKLFYQVVSLSFPRGLPSRHPVFKYGSVSKLMVDFCVNLDAAYLRALVIVFKSSFLILVCLQLSKSLCVL